MKYSFHRYSEYKTCFVNIEIDNFYHFEINNAAGNQLQKNDYGWFAAVFNLLTFGISIVDAGQIVSQHQNPFRIWNERDEAL